MTNAISWFEIPAQNFDRAKSFYEAILGTEMMRMDMMSMKCAFFSADLQNGVGGCIIEGQGYEPCDKGSLIYLNGGDDLNTILSKVESAGGKVTLPKMAIGENGFMAHFVDSEGNRIGLHSHK